MWISAALCPPGAAGAQPPLHGCTRQSQGYLSSGTWSSSFFSCSGCLQSCSSHSHSSLPPALVQYFLPLLKYVITEVLPVLLKGSALASSKSIVEFGEASGFFSQKSPLQSTPSPKPCHTNLSHSFNSSFSLHFLQLQNTFYFQMTTGGMIPG